MKVLTCICATMFFLVTCSKETVDIADTQELRDFAACSDDVLDFDLQFVEFPENVQVQNDLYFFDDNTGFTVGNAGTILKTINGGHDWTILNQYYSSGVFDSEAITSSRLLTAYFVNSRTGYIGGERERGPGNTFSEAVLLKTIDGGSSWVKTYISDAIRIIDLHFYDENNGVSIIFSEIDGLMANRLFDTHDSGDTWTLVEMPVDRLNSKFIYINSDKILLSGSVIGEFRDKLISYNPSIDEWDVLNYPENLCIMQYFIDEDNGFVGCGSPFSTLRSYKTVDGGISWISSSMPYELSSMIHFKNLDEGFIINPKFELISVGLESQQRVVSYQVNTSSDGGVSWESELRSSDCQFQEIGSSPFENNFYITTPSGLHKFSEN